MELLIYLVPVILWAIWSAFQGHEEGVFVIAKQGNKNPNINHDYHVIWTYQRAVIGLIVGLSFMVYSIATATPVWEFIFHLILLCSTLILVFPFIHDGVYFDTANAYTEPGEPRPYPDGWKTTMNGKAKFDFTYKQRMVMFIVGNIFLSYLVIQPSWFDYSGINLRNVVLTIAGVIIVIAFVYLFWNGYFKKWFNIK